MKKIYSLLLILFIVAGVFIGMSAGDYFALKKEPIDYYDLVAGEIRSGMHITTDIDIVWDAFATEETYNTMYGVKVSDGRESARYYMLPYFYKGDDGYIYLQGCDAIEVHSSSDIATLDKIVDDTTRWWNDTTGTVDYGMTTLHFDGTVKKMSSEMQGYMRDYYIACGYSAAEADEMIYPYVLEQVNPKGVAVSFWIGVGSAILACGILVFVLIQYFANGNSKVRRVAGSSNGYDYGYNQQPQNNTYNQQQQYGNSYYGQPQNGNSYYSQPQNGNSYYGQPQNGNPSYGQPQNGNSYYNQPQSGNDETSYNNGNENNQSF